MVAQMAAANADDVAAASPVPGPEARVITNATLVEAVNPEALLEGEQGVYIVKDRAGGMMRHPVDIASDGSISIGSGVKIGDTSAPIVSASLNLHNTLLIEVDGGWHRAMEEDGLLCEALVLCAQGHAPEVAAERARDAKASVSP